MYTKRKPYDKHSIAFIKNSLREDSFPSNPMNPKSISGDDFRTIGERSLMALERGVDIGVTIVPEFDADSDSFDMDVNCDWHHSSFDIAEKYGKMNVDSSRPADTQDGSEGSEGSTE